MRKMRCKPEIQVFARKRTGAQENHLFSRRFLTKLHTRAAEVHLPDLGAIPPGQSCHCRPGIAGKASRGSLAKLSQDLTGLLLADDLQDFGPAQATEQFRSVHGTVCRFLYGGDGNGSERGISAKGNSGNTPGVLYEGGDVLRSKYGSARGNQRGEPVTLAETVASPGRAARFALIFLGTNV